MRSHAITGDPANNAGKHARSTLLVTTLTQRPFRGGALAMLGLHRTEHHLPAQAPAGGTHANS